MDQSAVISYGKSLFLAGNYEEAFNYFSLKENDESNPLEQVEAWFYLGNLHLHGNAPGFKKDMHKTYFEKVKNQNRDIDLKLQAAVLLVETTPQSIYAHKEELEKISQQTESKHASILASYILFTYYSLRFVKKDYSEEALFHYNKVINQTELPILKVAAQEHKKESENDDDEYVIDEDTFDEADFVLVEHDSPGVRHYKNEEYEEAFTYFSKFENDSRDKDAQVEAWYYLGELYLNNNAPTYNPKKAKEYFSKVKSQRINDNLRLIASVFLIILSDVFPADAAELEKLSEQKESKVASIWAHYYLLRYYKKDNPRKAKFHYDKVMRQHICPEARAKAERFVRADLKEKNREVATIRNTIVTTQINTSFSFF